MRIDNGLDRRRTETRVSHLRGVTNALTLMRESFHEPLALDELADSAHMSSFHFSRVFKKATRLTPMQFLAAIRVAAAKRLLLGTARSVTGVCWDIGYESLGSFSAQFNEMVGVSPREWRTRMSELADRLAGRSFDLPLAVGERSRELGRSTGRITNAAPDALVCVGLFRKPIPFGRPEACSLCVGSSRFTLPTVKHPLFAFAIGFGVSELPRRLAGDFDECAVAVAPVPTESHFGTELTLALRPLTETDPPLLSALPLFLDQRTSQNTPYAVQNRYRMRD